MTVRRHGGFGLVTGFIGLYKFTLTVHSGATANSHSLQIPQVHTDCSQSAVPSPVLKCRLLAADISLSETVANL
jgi:hypothetical protein